MDQRIIELYDRFTHGQMSRRDFVDNLAKLAGSTAAAMALLPMLQNDYAKAQMVAPDDDRLSIETVSYDADGATISGQLTHLKGDAKRPAVLVIHENRGLNPHIQDVGRRIALEGFLVLAVDMLSPLGGTPADEDKGREMIGSLDPDETERHLVGAVEYLKSNPLSSGKVGTVGFCWGGGMVNRLAAASPDIDSAVAYYGRQIPAKRVANIEAPLLLHYAGLDNRINAGIADYESALKEHGKTYTIHMYEDANHAFNNDTNAARYNKEAADLAWGRTIAFFKEYLGVPPRG